MTSRHRRRPGDSDEDIDEEQFLQFRRQESSLMSRQSSVRSLRSQKSLILLDSQESSSQQAMSFTGLLGSFESQHESQASAAGIPREFDYLFRPSQNDEQVLALDVNSQISLSIGVVCVAQREASDNNLEIQSHALQKTFYSYPKNAEEKIKKTIENRIENDVADFKLQGYNVTTYTFGLPFSVEAVNNVTRGYDGKTKMLRASKKKNAMEITAAQEAQGAQGAQAAAQGAQAAAQGAADNVSSNRGKRARK
jgi:hypothetical protein